MALNNDKINPFQKIIALSKGNEELDLFTEYCELIDQGHRKNAIKKLNQFKEEINSKSIEKRISFVNWFEELLENNNDLYSVSNHIIRNEIILPTLDEWILKEPESPIPYRWKNDIINLLKSVELDENEKIARFRLINRGLAYIKMNQHELEQFWYMGNPKEDLILLEKIKEIIDELNLPNLKHERDQTNGRIEICLKHIEFEKETKNVVGKFANWLDEKYPEFNYEKYF